MPGYAARASSTSFSAASTPTASHQGLSVPKTTDEFCSSGRHPRPDQLLQGKRGPPGDGHSREVDQQLKGAAPDLIADAEGEAQRDVSGCRDGGDRDEYS
jgi:hypothetical protein